MTDERAPAAMFPPDQPIREAELCRVLGVSAKTLRRRGIRSVKLGKDRVYLWRWVVDYLEKTAA